MVEGFCDACFGVELYIRIILYLVTLHETSWRNEVVLSGLEVSLPVNVVRAEERAALGALLSILVDLRNRKLPYGCTWRQHSYFFFRADFKFFFRSFWRKSLFCCISFSLKLLLPSLALLQQLVGRPATNVPLAQRVEQPFNPGFGLKAELSVELLLRLSVTKLHQILRSA